jgi:hypothetical protein
MFDTTPKSFVLLKSVVAVSFSIALAAAPMVFAHDTHDHAKDSLDATATKTVTGEVVDMMCFVDHNATGGKHAQCAAKCIKGNGPVGIVENGKAYLVVGEHKPMNAELAEYAGKTVTLKGKVAERGGIAMIENAELVKQ